MSKFTLQIMCMRIESKKIELQPNDNRSDTKMTRSRHNVGANKRTKHKSEANKHTLEYLACTASLLVTLYDKCAPSLRTPGKMKKASENQTTNHLQTQWRHSKQPPRAN